MIPPRASGRPSDGAAPENDNGNAGGSESSGGADAPSLESQFARILREKTERDTQAMRTRWSQGGLRPRVVHESTSDWIRRVAFDWPNAVMGTAAGSVLVCNCEELGGLEYRERARRLLAKRKDAHSRDWTGLEERGLGERSLLGLYDAGAVTAVAIQDSTCASGGRDGWLKLWRIPPDADVEDPRHPKDGEMLVDAGRGEHPNVVTGVVIDAAGKCAWTSCLDGKIRAWSLTTRTDDGDAGVDGDGDDDTNNLELIGEWFTGQAALCLSLDTESRVLYAGTADGKAFAFDAGPVDGDELTDGFECGRVLSAWVAHDDGVTRSVSHARGGCLTGSSTGPMYAWRVDRDTIDGCPPTLARKMIGHVAAVVSISVGNPRHVVSGAHDGTVRVWNAPDLLAEDDEDEAPIAVDGGGGLDDGVKKSECLYAVTGHTVWLGGVQADETRIICDGANNIAMCYDFSEDPDDDGDI